MTPEYRESVSLVRAIAHPARLRLLDALRNGEECVCHLTTLLGQRQAYVSQQLMFLRRAGLIADRKDHLRVYYRVRDPRIFQVLDAVRAMTAAPTASPERTVLTTCPCPKCQSAIETRSADGEAPRPASTARRPAPKPGTGRVKVSPARSFNRNHPQGG